MLAAYEFFEDKLRSKLKDKIKEKLKDNVIEKLKYKVIKKLQDKDTIKVKDEVTDVLGALAFVTLREKKVLAFRKISAALTRIPFPQGGVRSQQPSKNVILYRSKAHEGRHVRADAEELSVSSALAYLLVADRGAGALATDYASTAPQWWSEEAQHVLQILACVSSQCLRTSSTSPVTHGRTPVAEAKEEDKLPDWMDLTNWTDWESWANWAGSKGMGKRRRVERRDVVDSAGYFIQACAPLNGLGDKQDVILYLKRLITKWEDPSLDVHLWILTKVLTYASNLESREQYNELRTTFYKYIFLFTRRKMQRQLTGTVSKNFLCLLQGVQEFEFNPDKSLKTLNKTQHDVEIEYDREFLVCLENNSDLLSPDEFPLISKIAKEVSAAKLGTRFLLHSENTTKEFHSLLLKLLNIYCNSVDGVWQAFRDPESSATHRKSLPQLLSQVYRVASTLAILSRSRAFRIHMKAVVPALHYGVLVDVLQKQSELARAQGEEEDLCAIMDVYGTETFTVDLANVLVKWLTQLVLPISAANQVLNFVTGPYYRHSAISIACLVAPEPDSHVISWDEMFQDPALFPEPLKAGKNATKRSKTGKDTTNHEIASYFRTHAQIAMKAYLFDQASSGIASTMTDNLEDSLEVMLEKSRVLFAKLGGELHRIGATEDNRIQLMKDVSALLSQVSVDLNLDALDSVLEKLDRVRMLCKTDIEDPNYHLYLEIGNKNKYDDTLHCEAYLAYVLDDLTKEARSKPRPPLESESIDVGSDSKIPGYGRVIGISRRCCPFCAHYLANLPESGSVKRSPFVVQEGRRHASIDSSCALPSTTPTEVLDKMIKHFGSKLRTAFVGATGHWLQYFILELEPLL